MDSETPEGGGEGSQAGRWAERHSLNLLSFFICDASGHAWPDRSILATLLIGLSHNAGSMSVFSAPSLVINDRPLYAQPRCGFVAAVCPPSSRIVVTGNRTVTLQRNY